MNKAVVECLNNINKYHNLYADKISKASSSTKEIFTSLYNSIMKDVKNMTLEELEQALYSLIFDEVYFLMFHDMKSVLFFKDYKEITEQAKIYSAVFGKENIGIRAFSLGDI